MGFVALILLGLLSIQAPSCPERQESFAEQRARMVRDQIEARGIRDSRVLDAMRRVPRHLFVLPSFTDQAYSDHALPIQSGQTISQPFIVAYMTQLLRPERRHVTLEVGTGSGYQAAVLSHLVAKVYTIELLPELAGSAALRLRKLGHSNIEVRQGDGYLGWPEHAPYDLIIVTAAPLEIPPALIAQLKPGGRMVIPTGYPGMQELRLLEKDRQGVHIQTVIPVAFVPLVKPQ